MPSSTVAKPGFAILLNSNFNLSLPSHYKNLEDVITFACKELKPSFYIQMASD
jgi:hypothetical protein